MVGFLKKNFFNIQFAKYVIVGLIGTVLDFSILYILVEYTHLHYVIGSVTSVLIVLWVSFSLNKFWTFKNRENKYFIQFFKYAVSHMIALGVSVGVMIILVEGFDFWYLFAKVFATVAAAITNFLIVKKFIFLKNSKV